MENCKKSSEKRFFTKLVDDVFKQVFGKFLRDFSSDLRVVINEINS